MRKSQVKPGAAFRCNKDLFMQDKGTGDKGALAFKAGKWYIMGYGSTPSDPWTYDERNYPHYLGRWRRHFGWGGELKP